MKILVCDDEQMFCDDLVHMLREYAEVKGFAIEVESVCSGIEAENRLKAAEYDLLFLDIEMKGLNGVILGKKIREEYQDYLLQIIYISSKQEYAMQLFRVRPFAFLIKPVLKERLFCVMDEFMRVREKQEELFIYRKKGSLHQCRVKNILYFESQEKKIIIHMLQGTDEFYAPLKEVSKSLADFHFFRCHHSFLVKYENVQAFYADHLILVNGERLEISQGKRSQVRDLMLKWGAR